MIRIQLQFGQGLDLISLGLPEDENWNFDVEHECTLEDLKNVLLQMCEGALRYDQLRLRKKGSPEELVEYLGAEKACTSTYKPRPCTLLNHGIKNGSALEVDILLSRDEERAIYGVHAHEEAPRAHVAAQPEAAPGASRCIDLTGEDSREGDNDVVLGLGPPSKRQRADFAGRDTHENIDGMAARNVMPDPAPPKSGQQQPPPEQLALPQRQVQPQQKQQTPDREHPLEAQRSPQPCTVQGPPQHGQEPTTQQQYGPPARRQAPGLPDQTAQAGQQVPESRQDHAQAATVQQPEGQSPQEPAPQQQAAVIQPIPTQRTSIELETQQRQRAVPETQVQRQQAAEGPLLHTPQRPPLPTVVRGKVEVARQQQPASVPNHGAYGGQEDGATGRKADADDAAPHRRVTARTGGSGHWSVKETQALADAMERYGRCWVAIERETKLRDQKTLRYKWRNLVTASENGWASTRGVQLPQELRQQIDDLYKRLGR
ncbi:hypothetical protein Vretimale_3396 [Volvox reticuliferus]|uniref:Myb-like domain-containing protein n=1 Tax=Volvox reticuliferus TaxID=1737510 RepID=A0A8J4G1F8_9CHLO|nr:hypothetical protein Vretimale_3396 [Volvox reticuliferus]